MKQKHLVENNKMIFFCVLLIEVVALVGGFLYREYLFLPFMVYLIPIVLGLAFTVFGRLKFVNNDKGHLFMLIGVAISFLTAKTENQYKRRAKEIASEYGFKVACDVYNCTKSWLHS